MDLQMDRTYSTESIDKIGEKVKVQGWVNSVRDHGQLLFIDLRDSKGVVQIVVDPDDADNFEKAKVFRNEYVIEVEGQVREREEDLVNEKIKTGKIEILASHVSLLNKSKPLPFPIDGDGRDIKEDLRLKYRYLDMRRDRVKNIMRKKHDLLLSVRNWMNDNDFLEVITPLLTSTSPEGARDYVVPSRLNLGEFFVLPQAPQQYKQLLMVGGVDKYFQIAPCARDEDPRADRHVGIFYQIDVEMSFPTQDKLFGVAENMLTEVYKKVAPNKEIMNVPFPRIPFSEAMERFGTDKPDIRFGMELKTITEVVKGNTDFNIFNSAQSIRCVVAKGAADWPRSEIEEMESFAKSLGAKGLAYTKVGEDGLETGIAKFMKPVQDELIKESGAEKGDLLFFGAGDYEDVNKILGGVRQELARRLDLIDDNKLAFVWITEFPFYEMEDGKLDFGHNPFSMPIGGVDAFDEDPLQIKSHQYDLALNGYEVLSGSIRNHNPEILVKAFEKLGYDADEVKKRFGGLYNAFQYGAPPHGGWAIGFDRLFMVLIDESNIRDTYAFPKSSSGHELMMGAPSTLDEAQMKELGIKLTDEAKENLAEKKRQTEGRGELVRDKIIQILDEAEVEYKYSEHKEVKTSQEAADLRGVSLSEGRKALIVKGKDSSNNFMFVIPADKRLSLEKASKEVGEKVIMEEPNKIYNKYGIKVGGVPPFGQVFDMKVYFDESNLEERQSNFNCGLRTASIEMNTEDLYDVLKAEKGDFVE
jgi:aspartyl-tRNA synthetase